MPVAAAHYTHSTRMMANMADTLILADGSVAVLGLRVYRCYPQDGSRFAGKRRGPKLILTALRDLHEGGQVRPNALAVLKQHGGSRRPAGTEPLWNLRRAVGFQPKVHKARAARPSSQHRGVPVSSIRLAQSIRDRLLLRGDELGWTMRRDVERLYDLLDDARARMIFPAGTLEALAKAWTFAAPPPPHNTLRPQWFVPVILDACRRVGTEAAMKLAGYAESWNQIEALAVQDAVERWEPEASHTDKLRTAGLQDEPPEEATVEEIDERLERRGRKVKA
jgi:hypothetical protein